MACKWLGLQSEFRAVWLQPLRTFYYPGLSPYPLARSRKAAQATFSCHRISLGTWCLLKWKPCWLWHRPVSLFRGDKNDSVFFFSVSFQSSSFTWSMRCSTWSHIDMLCSLSPASEEICLLVMESVLFMVVTYLFYCKNCWVYGTCEFQGKSFVGYAQICGISHNCWNEKLLKKFLPGHLEEKKRITEEWTWGKDGGAQNNRWGRG